MAPVGLAESSFALAPTACLCFGRAMPSVERGVAPSQPAERSDLCAAATPQGWLQWPLVRCNGPLLPHRFPANDNPRIRTRYPPAGDEDQQAGVQADGQGRTRHHRRRWRAGRPPRGPAQGPGRHTGQGAEPPDQPGSPRLRLGAAPDDPDRPRSPMTAWCHSRATPAGARRPQPEGDDIDRIPRPGRAQARAGTADRRRRPHVLRGARPWPRLRHRR